ncbi:MAG: SlyX family protein [Congregibacter sp.]|nr:SlyX family protein [Congregibacter sp.]
MDDDQLDAEIGRLQAEMAFQGDSVHRLNEALATQQREILMLQRQVVLLGEQLRAMREGHQGRDGAPETEKPPHY